MILFTILLLGLLLSGLGGMIFLSVKSITFLFVYGDIIVCIFIIMIIIRHLKNRKD